MTTRTINRRKTLADVAAAAGVSVSTASAVLGNRPHCFASETTKRHVVETARRIGYTPNFLARGLRGERTHIIGMVIFGFDQNAIANAKLQSIEDTAWKHGYRLLIGTHKDDRSRMRAYVDEFLGRAVDAVIFWPTTVDDAPIIRQVRDAGVAVLALEAAAPFGVADLSIDREHGGYLQVKHLLESGRRRPAFFFTSHKSVTGSAKVRGVERALAEAGLSLSQFPVYEDPKPASVAQVGVTMTQQLLRDKHDFDAVVTFSDRVALATIAALIRSGRRVPEDAAVVGFDDEFAPEGQVVPVTTIRQPRAIGPTVFDLLLPQIRGGTEGQEPRSVRLHPELVVRESTVKGAGLGLTSPG